MRRRGRAASLDARKLATERGLTGAVFVSAAVGVPLGLVALGLGGPRAGFW